MPVRRQLRRQLQHHRDVYSTDRLTLSPSFAVCNFWFGCSHCAVTAPTGSWASQMVEKVFSYCLPPTASYSGFLTLSVSAPLPRPRASASSLGFVVTPMYKIDTFYLVLLDGITMAERLLRVPRRCSPPAS